MDCGNKSYRFGSPLIIIRQLMFMSKGIWCKPSRASDQQWHTFSLLTVQSMGPMFFLARSWVQSHFVSSWLHICKIWDLFVSVPVIALSISYLLANTFLLSSIIMITTHPINTLANPTLKGGVCRGIHYFCSKTLFGGTRSNRLSETVRMCIHNLCFEQK